VRVRVQVRVRVLGAVLNKRIFQPAGAPLSMA